MHGYSGAITIGPFFSVSSNSEKLDYTGVLLYYPGLALV